MSLAAPVVLPIPLPLERKAVKRWLLWGDGHSGSAVGLLPPNFEYVTNKMTVPVPQSRGQARLWEYVQDIAARTKVLRPNVIFLLGDLIKRL